MMQTKGLRHQYYKIALQTFWLFRLKPNAKVDTETWIMESIVA